MSEKKKILMEISKISMMHYFKLVFRSVLFCVTALFYILGLKNKVTGNLGALSGQAVFLGIVAAVFFVGMLFRFFPSKLESTGCQKQFARKFKKIPESPENPKLKDTKGALISAALWILLNGIIAVLYFTRLIDAGALILISMAYAVCDMVCILFFCPFQTLIMKNKCCTTCRIYNWDYLMMFTPLIFIRNAVCYVLVAGAVALLLVWEISVHKRPYLFSEETNLCLSCAHCEEKLCHHKKQLHGFFIANKEKLKLKGNAVYSRLLKELKKEQKNEEL